MSVQNSKKVDVRNKNPDYSAKKPSGIFSKKTKDAKYNLRPNTIIIAGCARLPEGITAKHVFGCLTIELEIDPVDSTVVDMSCALVPSLGKKILHNALLGSNVHKGIEEAIVQLDKRFFNATRRTVIAALEDAYRWYKKSLKKTAVQNSE